MSLRGNEIQNDAQSGGIESIVDTPVINASDNAVTNNIAGNAPEQSNNLPTLRYLDRTPMVKPDSKRSRFELSPIEQSPVTEVTMNEAIAAAVSQTVKQVLPKIVEEVKATINESIKTMIGQLMADMKREILKEMREEAINQQREADLKMLCETEMLESYNRRDNVRIIGVPEASKVDANNRPISEASEETMAKVVGIAQQIDAKMDERDISISHRLPGRQQERPIIVRFSRRVGKIELLRKKKKLAESEATKKIKIFEDLTQARSKFLTMMRCDTRIASTWTREGTIFFQMGRRYKNLCN